MKERFKELFFVYGIGIFLTLLASVFFHIRGYPKVVTATETLDIITPPIYMIPIFLPYGILLGELLWIWLNKEGRNLFIIFFVECFAVGALSFFRYLIGVPFSGHTLILAFFLFHQIFTNKHKYSLRILVGFIVLIITIVYKIFLWNDPITFFLGIIIGIALWFPGFLFKMKFETKGFNKKSFD